MLGLVFYWQSQYEAALEQYEHERAWVASSQHAQRDRIEVELDQKFSAVLWRMGRHEESDRHFQEALGALSGGGQTRAIDPLVMYGMAALLTLRGDVMRAFEYLDDARTRVPAFVQVLLSADPDFQRVREDALR
jgi:tetratricopeptide (TPR) repeat protein